MILANQDFEADLRDLELALPIEALRSIITERERKHKPRAHIRHRLTMLRAEPLAREAA